MIPRSLADLTDEMAVRMARQTKTHKAVFFW